MSQSGPGGLVSKMWNAGLVKFGRFKLASGMESPYYIDLRPAPSFPDLFDEVSEVMAERIQKEATAFDKIAGVELAGIPLSTIVAHKLRKPMVYVRKSKKEYGTGERIEGVLSKRDTVLVLDDVLTTGGSLSSAILALREAGAQVDEAAVFVDRMQGGAVALRQLGVRVLKVYDVLSLFSELRELRLIDSPAFRAVKASTADSEK